MRPLRRKWEITHTQKYGVDVTRKRKGQIQIKPSFYTNVLVNFSQLLVKGLMITLKFNESVLSSV